MPKTFFDLNSATLAELLSDPIVARAVGGPGRLNELYPLDLGEQVHELGEERLVQLGRPRVVEPAHSAASGRLPRARVIPG